MGVASVCDQGFVVSRCRCPEQHGEPKVVECDHQEHRQEDNWQIIKGVSAVVGKIKARTQVMRESGWAAWSRPEDGVLQCPRCSVYHAVGDFRGGVCGWCAEDLEKIPEEGW